MDYERPADLAIRITERKKIETYTRNLSSEQASLTTNGKFGSVSNRSSDVKDAESLVADSVKEALIAEILDAAITEIELVNTRSQGPTVSSDFHYKTIEKRFIEPQLNTKKMGIYENYKFHEDVRKLHKNSDFLCQLLSVISDEMRRYGTFESLTKALENIKNMKKDENDILFPIREQNDEINIYELAKSDKELQDIRIKMEFTLFEQSTTDMLKKRYIQQWEDARIEQSLLFTQKEENNLRNIITEQVRNIDNEEYITDKATKFLQEAIIDAKSEIAKWEEKYEIDFEKKALELKLITEKRSDMKEEYAKLCYKYYERQNHINDIITWFNMRRIEKIREEDSEKELEEERLEEYKNMNQEKKKKKKKGAGKGKEKKRRTA